MKKASNTSGFRIDSEIHKIKAEVIDRRDTFFLMSYGCDKEAMRRSVEEYGILNPLLIMDRGDGDYVLVSGFCRYDALPERKKDRIPVRKVTGGRNEIYKAVLLENLSHRSLNPVELSMVLNGLARFLPEEDIVNRYMPAAGRDPSAKMHRRYLDVLKLERPIKDALAGGRLNMTDVGVLLKHEPADRKAIFEMQDGLGMGAAVRKETAVNLFEIAKRGGPAPAEFLARPKIAELINCSKTSLPEKAAVIRKIISECRYPRLTELECRFTDRVKSLKLPAHINITPPRYFEENNYRCTFIFRSDDEFKETVEKLHGVKSEKILPEEDNS